MTRKPLPSAEVLRAILRYDAPTGRLFWRERAEAGRGWAVQYAGRPAGGASNGIMRVRLAGYGSLLAHRVIWKMAHGTEPPEIDHVNGNPLDNRLDNLREASHSRNCSNRGPRQRASGFRGVTRQGRRWRATIQVDGRWMSLGSFDDPAAAHAAYRRAAQDHFGAFARLD